ncbi:TPA: arginine--tRNA ligase [Candidatus Micrarchaeota archaeon]|nr:arginine--tRNA ligase [Candidatus Micrarchaeota archaeon]
MKSKTKGHSENTLLESTGECEKTLDSIIEKTFGVKIQSKVSTAKEHGDLALPCFPLASQLKKNPREIAEKLAAEFNRKPARFFQRAEALNGFVNFFFNGEFYARVLGESSGGNYGKTKPDEKEKIMVEFPSPNTNKPLHLGHLRNIFLATSIAALNEFSGRKVYRVDLNNDRGVHICKSMLAYERFGSGREPDKKSDHFVGDFYVKYAQEEKSHPELEEEIKEMLRKWEDGDKKVRALWTKMNGWALQGFDETYARLGVKFDKVYSESEFYDKAKKVVEEGLEKGVFKKTPDGAVIAELEQFKLPNKILLRADGTSIYMTQDIYLAEQKFKDFKVDKSIYVVGSEQNLHFQQLFKILELLGYDWAKNCIHLSYGMVNLPTGRMKSREGTVVDADNLIDEVESLAAGEITKRHPEVVKEELKERASLIGQGALRFFILKFDPRSELIYNPEESVSFEGDTGPYVQYTCVRARSIIEKAEAGKKPEGSSKAALEFNDEEKKVLSLLSRFPQVAQSACTSMQPHQLCEYLLRLSASFNEFYHKHSVLNAYSEGEKQKRIALVQSTASVLENGLSLLGIKVPEKM